MGINNNYTVLITGAGAPGMPGVLKCLKKANDSRIRYIGADMNEYASCRHEFDVFFQIPAASDSEFINAIFRICEKENVDLVVPCVTRELYKLSKEKERFHTIGTTIAVMDYDKLIIVNNKGRLLSYCEANNIDVPKFILIDQPEQFEDAAKEVGYPNKPFVIKGCEGNGSRAVRVILPYKNLAERFFEDKPNGSLCDYETAKQILNIRYPWPCQMMIMQYLPGVEYAVDILARDGAIISAVCRRASLVVSSNQMQCVVEDNKQVLDLCERVVSKLKLDGNIGFDLKEDEMGHPQIIEINPRFTGGIVACCAAGVNFPYLGICDWLGIPYEIPSVKYGVRMVRRLEELFFDKANQQIFL